MSKWFRYLLGFVAVATLSSPHVSAQSSPHLGPAAADTAAPRLARDAAISDEVLRAVAKLRGLTILHPVTNGLRSRDAIKSMVLKDMAESSTPARMADSSAMLRFLGLVPSDFDLENETVALLTDQIAGFYDPRTKIFYLADWIPVELQRTVMAHELTHALTDQHFNLRRLEKWPEGDGDAELAARALVEGDATAMMIEYELAQRGAGHDLSKVPVELTDLLKLGAGEEDPEHPVYAAAPAVMRESLQFPYVYGAGFVQALLRAGQWSRVSDAYRVFPASTEQILHPEKYLANEAPVKVEMPDLSKSLGPGWRRADDDVNGEFGYYLILKDKLREQEAAAAAAGWGGDRYAFYRDATGSQGTFVHVSAWDTEADAREFYAAYSARIVRRYGLVSAGDSSATSMEWDTQEGKVRIERRGARVFVVEGFRGADVGPLFKMLIG